MNFSEYQESAVALASYPRDKSDEYLFPSLSVEANEVLDLWAKGIRDGYSVDRDKLKGELGDVLWFVAALCWEYSLSMEEVAEGNIAKLQDRKKRGVLHGSGSNR